MFGKELKRARLKAGLTQEDVAARAKVTREYVSMLELEKSLPTIEVFVRLCRAVGISAAVMIEDLDRHIR